MIEHAHQGILGDIFDELTLLGAIQAAKLALAPLQVELRGAGQVVAQLDEGAVLARADGLQVAQPLAVRSSRHCCALFHT